MTAATKVRKPAAKPGAKTFFEAAKESGLVGCFAGPTDLAENHSQYLKVKPRARSKAAR